MWERRWGNAKTESRGFKARTWTKNTNNTPKPRKKARNERIRFFFFKKKECRDYKLYKAKDCASKQYEKFVCIDDIFFFLYLSEVLNLKKHKKQDYGISYMKIQNE